MIQPHNGFDIEAAHKIVAAIEKIQGWTPQKNARYRLDENNQFIRNKPREKPEPSEKAQKFESETGAKSAQRIAQERAHKIIEKATSWEELHNGLKKVGLRLEKKGSGAIVFVGETEIKASAIDRNFSLGKLCKRLREFQPGDYAAHVEKIDPEPLTHVAQKSWREYMGLRKSAIAERRQKREKIKQQREAAMREVLKKQLAHREMAYKGIAQFGWSVLNIGRSFLKRQQIQERAEARKNLPKMPKNGFKRFKDWLGERNPRLADAWRIHRWITPDMKIGHFPEGHLPRTGKMKQPFAAYAEMVKRRYADLKAAKSILMRQQPCICAVLVICAKRLRKNWRDTPRPSLLSPIPRLAWATGGVSKIMLLERRGDIIVIEHKLKMSEIERFNQEAEKISIEVKQSASAQNLSQSQQQKRRLR